MKTGAKDENPYQEIRRFTSRQTRKLSSIASATTSYLTGRSMGRTSLQSWLEKAQLSMPPSFKRSMQCVRGSRTMPSLVLLDSWMN